MSNATYNGKDQNWTDGSTTYWFEVDGEQYGVVEGNGAGIVDCGGYPIDGMGDEPQIRRALDGAVTDEMRAE